MPRRMPSGACCPANQHYDEPLHACVAAGPWGCVDAYEHPQRCWPSWCFVWRTVANQPCDRADPACLLQPVACVDAVQGAEKCAAGRFPHRLAGGACVPAGAWFPGDATPTFDPQVPTPPLGALRNPPGNPPVAPLPGADASVFCRDASGNVSLDCAQSAAPCPPGTAPRQGDATACVTMGLAGHCPDGFGAGGPRMPSDAALPGRVPDPADCGSAPYGDNVPADAVFVDIQAPAGGNCSAAKPCQTLLAGLQSVPPGGTVVVAAGTYTLDGLAIGKPLTIRGRCPALVRIQGGGGVAFEATGTPVGGGARSQQRP